MKKSSNTAQARTSAHKRAQARTPFLFSADFQRDTSHPDGTK